MAKGMKGVVWALVALGAIVAVAVASGEPVEAQSPPVPVFTAEQAAAGKVLFTKVCASCHLADLTGNDDAPPLAGASFQALWKGRSTKELLDYMSGAMPPGGSTLNAENYAAIVAYVLERNGATAGSQMLTVTTAVPIGSVIK
jgi:S-disulfanyl-L-cysteine oxidoreductase SoxD